MATVYIIDDDESVRRALSRLLRSAGLEPVAFASPDQFAESDVARPDACVIADVRMPGGSGLDLPELLRSIRRELPVIILTAQDTEPTRAAAKRAGAAAFFCKPVDDQALLDAIHWVLSGQALAGP